jgi:hypothetical protein
MVTRTPFSITLHVQGLSCRALYFTEGDQFRFWDTPQTSTRALLGNVLNERNQINFEMWGSHCGEYGNCDIAKLFGGQIQGVSWCFPSLQTFITRKRLRGPLRTLVFDTDSSLAAVLVNFFGLCRKLARTRSASTSAVNGRPLDFCLHRHPVSVNCLYHAWMVLSVGGSFAYFARNALCTVTTDLIVWYSNTQNDFIFSLHKLASPSGRNMNYDEKQLTGEEKNFELFILSVQVS